ncbi:type VII secretion-associated serine protease mycosin [Arthrobacter pigmenti]
MNRPVHRHRIAVLVAGIACALVSGLVTAPAAVAEDGIRERQYWLDEYGIREAWDESKGAGVKVAVIDSGIDGDHPDLQGAIAGGTDVSGSGHPKGLRGLGDSPEHGTLVATLLAGRGHAPDSGEDDKDTKSPDSATESDYDGPGNGPDGIIGVAPQAKILGVSAWLGVEKPNPSGKSVDQQIPDAVRWAVDHGADVINMSLGSTSTSWPQSWDDAFLYAEKNDVLIVAAAGNRGAGMEQAGAPATIPGVLTVAGVDRNGKASWDSSSQGITIGVAAPAEDLVGGLPGGGYALWSGTSGAAPIVSGVAALIRSKWPNMSANQVIQRIIATADDAGAPGNDVIYGHGLLDAEAALTADVPQVQSNPLGTTLAEWIRLHRPAKSSAIPEQAPLATDGPEEPTIPVHDAPAPIEPAGLNEDVPRAIVIGFGVLIGLVVIAGVLHVMYLRRRDGAAEEDGGGTGDGG